MKAAIIIFILLGSAVFAQVAQQWANRYNSPVNFDDTPEKLCVDPSGNIIVTGSSYNAASDMVYTTIKYSPNGSIVWIEHYNGPGTNGNDVPNDITCDAAGNIYVTGQSDSGSTVDFMTIKYNSAGVQQWRARYVNDAHSYNPHLAVDAVGNVYVTGNNYYNNVYTIITIKYNSAGVQQWALPYQYAGGSAAASWSIEIDGTGAAIITGWSNSSTSNNDMVTIKYNPAGFAEWVQRYNHSGNYHDAGYYLAIDNLNNVLIAGTINDTGVSYSDIIAVKYSPSGTQQWFSVYNGPANFSDYTYGIVVDNLGNSYIAVTSYLNSAYSASELTSVKYNSSGAIQWSKRYNGGFPNVHHFPNDIIIDRYSNIYLTGGSSLGIPNQFTFFTIKYNTNGDSLWTARYQGPSMYGQTVSMGLDSLNNVYVTGFDYGIGTVKDFVTVRYTQPPLAPSPTAPANGSTGISLTPLLDWADVPNSTTYRLQVSADSTFATTVVNQTGLAQSQYTIASGVLQNNVRYYWRSAAVNIAGSGPWSPVWNFTTGFTGISQTGTEIPKEFRLYNNYPNPFNPVTRIKFDLPAGQSRLVKIAVFDLLGKAVSHPVNYYMAPGSYEVEFDARSFASGVYFYRIEAGKFTALKKMILTK